MEERLRSMAESGFNLLQCGNRDALDAAHELGLMGWVPLNVQDGTTRHLKTGGNTPRLPHRLGGAG